MFPNPGGGLIVCPSNPPYLREYIQDAMIHTMVIIQ